MGTNKLPKYNRLAGRKHIAMLFKEGHIIKLPPCTVFYLQKERKTLSCNKVLFTVSKRNVPSAVRRNRIKRLLREAYRTNRHILDDVLNNANCELVFLIGYVYTGKEEKIHYPILKGAVVRSLQHFSSLLNTKTLK